MAITYIEKGLGLHEAVTAAGYFIRNVDGVRIATDSSGNQSAETDVAVQAIIDSYDPLSYAKKQKVKELRSELLARIRVIYPDAENIPDDTFDAILDITHDVYKSIVAGSRSPNSDWSSTLDTRTARKDARNIIEAYTTVAEVEAYDVVTDPAWPV